MEIVAAKRRSGALELSEDVGQTDGERVAFCVGAGVAEHGLDGGVGIAGGEREQQK